MKDAIGALMTMSCVDPDALFNSGLFTLPPPAKRPKSCKKAKGMKGKAMMGKKATKSMKHMKIDGKEGEEEHERYDGALVASLDWFKIRIIGWWST